MKFPENKVTIYFHEKKPRKVRLERKINQEKQTNKQQQQQQQQQKQQQAKNNNNKNSNNKKIDTLPAQPIFPKDFSQVVYLFVSQEFIS